MAIQIGWYLEGRVLYERFFDQVTAEELARMGTRSDTLLTTSPVPIHTLVDLTDVKSFPANLSKIQHLLTPRIAIRRGWMAIVVPDGNPLLHFVVSYAAQVRSPDAPYHMFRKLATAVDFLNSQEHGLDLPLMRPTVESMLLSSD